MGMESNRNQIANAKTQAWQSVCLTYRTVRNEKKRQLYVAMTRAKQNLTIHLNGNYLDDITCDDLTRRLDENPYDETDLLILHLTHKDIWLDYFISRQNLMPDLKSGDTLATNKDGCSDAKGNSIVKFSANFKEKLLVLQNKGYQLQAAVINYIVYWQKEDADVEVKIVLPELKLQKAIPQSLIQTGNNFSR